MARRKRKVKSMTITSKFNRLAKGLQFFGEQIAEKKRATKKQLKELQKFYQHLRKQLKQDQPDIELPTIAQAAKYIKEQEQQPLKEAETREPLPYSDYTDETPQIDFSSNVLDDFLDTLQEAMNELVVTYGQSPRILDTMTKQHSEIITTFNTLKETIGEENLATHITQSLEYEALGTITKYSYNGVIEVLDNILTNLQGILNQANDYYNNPQTFANGINFDNL